MEKLPRFNQCQDCGCPGAQIMIDQRLDNTMAARCPYCGRRSDFLDANGDLSEVFTNIVENWNSLNRENKEGLA